MSRGRLAGLHSCVWREKGREGWNAGSQQREQGRITASHPRFYRNCTTGRSNSSPSQLPEQLSAGTSDWCDCDITEVLSKLCFYFY